MTVKKIFTLLYAVAALCACSEKIDISVGQMDKTYLIVESFLTDRADEQQIVQLSESVGYFSDTQSPKVTGAQVSVDDGGSTVIYEEIKDNPGTYRAPKGFCGKPGIRYHLSIRADIKGEKRSYDAWSTMPEPGFQLDSIDYIYSGDKEAGIDSLWTLFIWGQDKPQTGYFYISSTVNGYLSPYNLSLSMDDKYFAGQRITAFPIAVLSLNSRNQKLYGPCCKALERGDVVGVYALTLSKDCYEFFTAMASNVSGHAIPLLSSQPANCPTNITGGDAMGYFAACPVISATRVVDDPFRKRLLSMPFLPLH